MVGDLIGDGEESVGVVAETGHGGEEAFGVGVEWVFEDFVDVGVFDDAACVHDGDDICVFCDDAEVVGDEHHAHAVFVLEAAEEFEDLGLDGDVECGGGFVGEEECGATGEGHGDHDALSHTA